MGEFIEALSVPQAILFSALVAISVGVIGWRVSRRVARENAAFSLIVERERDYRADSRGVSLLILRKVNVGEIAKHADVGKDGADWETALLEEKLPTKQKQNLFIGRLLNFYEAMAVAIFEKIVDEKTVKRFLVDRFRWHIEELYPFISASRGTEEIGDEEVWIELENLARRWGAELPEPQSEHECWLEKLIHNMANRLSNSFSALARRTAPRRR